MNVIGVATVGRSLTPFAFGLWLAALAMTFGGFALSLRADSFRSGRSLATRDDAKIEFTAVDVHPGHGHEDRVAQAISISAAIAGKRVAGPIESIEIVVQRADMHEAFGRQLDSLDEKPELLDAGHHGFQGHADAGLQIFEQLCLGQFALGGLAALFALRAMLADHGQVAKIVARFLAANYRLRQSESPVAQPGRASP